MYLNKFILDGLCSLQLCFNHLDELDCPIFGPNIAETGFLKELQEGKIKEVKSFNIFTVPPFILYTLFLVF